MEEQNRVGSTQQPTDDDRKQRTAWILAVLDGFKFAVSGGGGYEVLRFSNWSGMVSKPDAAKGSIVRRFNGNRTLTITVRDKALHAETTEWKDSPSTHWIDQMVESRRGGRSLG